MNYVHNTGIQKVVFDHLGRLVESVNNSSELNMDLACHYLTLLVPEMLYSVEDQIL